MLHGRAGGQAAEELLASLPGTGHCLLAGDLADPATPERLFAGAVERVGRLGVVVNNAGIFEEVSFDAPSLAAWRQGWRRTMQVNLEAAAELAFLAVAHMREHGGGKIIQVASRAAFRGETDYPAYAVSKAGMVNLSVCLARALASVINIIDPDVIVLGGGVSNIGSLYTAVTANWDRYVFSDRVDTELLTPKYGDSSGVRGAAWLWNDC